MRGRRKNCHSCGGGGGSGGRERWKIMWRGREPFHAIPLGSRIRVFGVAIDFMRHRVRYHGDGQGRDGWVVRVQAH